MYAACLSYVRLIQQRSLMCFVVYLLFLFLACVYDCYCLLPAIRTRCVIKFGWAASFGRGDDTVANPRLAETSQFESFQLFVFYGK